ncbi:hypothetical protein [Acetobacterium woodii]|uniref:Uncharacterized protein n=1 Tax=Acetobacterium woodii (strain ATCC 29683 / DSM 1030 / JCM 2381 / KCTC 1655 / WB1) TaxID=931626 RepID=H6LDE9_ACEWD|nr:hypothetical protein [Acetobacterium woodii]AFA47921.1 hypothetical protein Awo_c11370 [Acetobacterium woodii DSM 1030]
MTAIMSVFASMIFGMGLFKLLCGVFELPTKKEYQMIIAVGKRKKEKISVLDNLVFWLSHFVVRFISIRPYQRKRLVNTLKSLGIRDTPEMIYAKAFVRGMVYIAIGFVLAVISPLVTALFILVGVYIILRDIQMTDKLMIEKRAQIEKELPRFAGRLEQELKYRTDVVKILEDYRRSSKGALGEELEITISDMRSSNYENALSRMETRIGISDLSEVLRGLSAVLRGDENVDHFRSLTEQFRNKEKNRLNREVEKRIERTMRYSYLIVIVFLAEVMYPLFYDILSTLPQIF